MTKESFRQILLATARPVVEVNTSTGTRIYYLFRSAQNEANFSESASLSNAVLVSDYSGMSYTIDAAWDQLDLANNIVRIGIASSPTVTSRQNNYGQKNTAQIWESTFNTPAIIFTIDSVRKHGSFQTFLYYADVSYKLESRLVDVKFEHQEIWRPSTKQH